MQYLDESPLALRLGAISFHFLPAHATHRPHDPLMLEAVVGKLRLQRSQIRVTCCGRLFKLPAFVLISSERSLADALTRVGSECLADVVVVAEPELEVSDAGIVSTGRCGV